MTTSSTRTIPTPITYTLHHEGKTYNLTGGYPTTFREQKPDGSVVEVPVVLFKEKLRGSPYRVGYSTRPDLASQVAQWNSERDALAAEARARDEAWQAEQATVRAPLLAAMVVKEAELVASIPADGVRVEAKELSPEFPISVYSLDGVKLPKEKVVSVGSASATLPGTWGPFATVEVAYILRAALETIHAEIDAKRQAAAQAKAEAEAKDAADIAAALETAKESGKPTRYKITGWEMDGGHEYAYSTEHFVRPDGSLFTKRAKEYAG